MEDATKISRSTRIDLSKDLTEQSLSSMKDGGRMFWTEKEWELLNQLSVDLNNVLISPNNTKNTTNE